MAVLELRDVAAGSRGREVLRGVGFALEAGDVYLLVGKPGAGKTILLGIASGQIEPGSGSVRLYGHRYARYARRVAAVVGRPSLFPNMSVRDNLMVRALSLGVPQPKDAVEKALDRFGLAGAAEAKTVMLSVGSRAWLGLAWALIGSPDLLVLDDILFGLDPIERSKVVSTLRSLAKEKGVTLLLSSREFSPLMSIATRIGVLVDGSIEREYSQDELRRALRGRIYVRTSNMETTLARMEDELTHASVVLTEDDSLEIAGSSLDEVSRLLDRFPERIVELREESVLANNYELRGERGPRC